jgi:hypothetical protein
VLFVFLSLLKALVFLKLLVTDGDYLGIEDHAIHFFDIVLILVDQCLGPLDEMFFLLLFVGFELTGGQLGGADLV